MSRPSRPRRADDPPVEIILRIRRRYVPRRRNGGGGRDPRGGYSPEAWCTGCVTRPPTCYAVLIEGRERSSEIFRFEREGLTRIELAPATEGDVRLACQLTISGDMTELRSGVRPLKRS